MDRELDGIIESTPSQFVQEKDGKKVFVGKEDPNNPPVSRPTQCVHGSDRCSHMRCPVCGGYFDYLLGVNNGMGGRQGCEQCWRP